MGFVIVADHLQIMSAVEDQNFGLRRDANQREPGLDADTHTENRSELTERLAHGDNCGALIHADNSTNFACETDEIARAKTVRLIIR